MLEAAKAWVQAEWYFRLGPNAYSALATNLFIAAEEALRKAATGKKYLGNAGKALGLER